VKFFFYLINSLIIFVVSFFIAFLLDQNTFKDKNIGNTKIDSVIGNTEKNKENTDVKILTETNSANQEPSSPLTKPSVSTITKPAVENNLKNLEVADSKNNCFNENEILLVDITINQLVIPEAIRVEKTKDGKYIVPKNFFEDLNIIPKNSLVKTSDCLEGYLLDDNYKFKIQQDTKNFALNIEAPVETFGLSIYNKRKILTEKPEVPKPGGYLNYQISSSRIENTTNTSAFLEQIGFGKFGSLSNELIVKNIETQNTVVRGDTYLRKDFPDIMETLIIGDASTSDGSWSRAARYAGVNWSTNYRLQPNYIYIPNQMITGSAALPSVVDIYINNQKTYSQKINPGPFNFSNLPVSGGAGNVDLVVTDVLGNQQIIKSNFYSASTLYGKGEKDFSFETGLLREEYGTANANYTSPFISGTYLYGISDSLTARSRLELQSDRNALGGDVSTSIGNFALVNVALASSGSDNNGRDQKIGFGFETSRKSFGLRLNEKYFGKNFTEFAETGSSNVKTKTIRTAGISLPIYENLGLSADYISSSYWNDNGAINLLNLSSGSSLPFGGNLSVSGSKRWDNLSTGWNVGATISYDFNGINTRYSQSGNPNGTTSNSVNVSSNPPTGPGLGWNAATENFGEKNSLSTVLNTNTSQWVLALDESKNKFSERLGVSGSLGYMQNEFFRSRTIGASSFAIAKVGDVEGINVYGDNQLKAVTNNNGVAVIPIFPYSKSIIEIKDEDMPLEYSSSKLSFEATTYARTGVFLDFPIKISKNALVLLELNDGSPVPAGASVATSNNAEKFIVARRGEVYLMDISEKNHLTITWLDNKCELDLVIDLKKKEEEIFGPFKCILK